MRRTNKLDLRGYRGRSLDDIDRITCRPLVEGTPYPMLVRPRVKGVRLAEWGARNPNTLEKIFLEHRSLLFRGFDMEGIEGFEEFVRATSQGDPLPYRDRSTPRRSYGKNVYCTTIFPAELRIRLHNEGSYWLTWAKKAYFGCVVAPPVGGATPIGDVHQVYRRLPERIREPFRRHGVLYVRNYNDGLGLPWQEVFQTEDHSQVEAYCRANEIEWEWKDGDRLRTRTVRAAIRNHPVTGEALWFNHAAFFHSSALDDTVLQAMLANFGEQGLPYQTYLGNGDPLPDDVVCKILAAYDAEEIRFRWQEGDVHLIDNMRLAHAREPYEGDRLILVALTEPDTGCPAAPKGCDKSVR
ncbi:MAG: taurine catabolism dioxygenase TauD [Planctomycetes bacterium]|jgi:alpha-ketoglutarate-dependent taurine dioxygenase|nr:taurine catabolism dioxygenase TauD [Planctomycetota bacterium]